MWDEQCKTPSNSSYIYRAICYILLSTSSKLDNCLHLLMYENMQSRNLLSPKDPTSILNTTMPEIRQNNNYIGYESYYD